jgi:uncharacterized protein involved in exopolysaccharide biosynthesis
MADEHEPPQSKLDVIEILRRRGALFLWVAAVVVLIGVAVAYRQTPIYASRGLLLAELPQVSESVVRSVQPESRVTLITQRVLTDENKQRIIDEHGLYPDLAGMPAEARGRFNDNYLLSVEEPQILEALLGTTRPEGAMALSVGFQDPSPRVARDVADSLIALYLEENREARREQAAETIRFLTQEARRIETEIAAREQRIAEFRTKNAAALPELADSNRDLLDRTSRDIDAVEQEIRLLRDQQALYSSQISLLSPSIALPNETGGTVLSPFDRLKLLQREYLRLSSMYSLDHPDVQRTRRELDQLAGSTGLPAFDRATLESELQAREDQLADARDQYGAEHPDVKALQRAVDAARRALQEAPATPTTRRLPTTPDNPAYIQAQAQLRAAENGLAAAIQRRADLNRRYEELSKQLQVTPEIEREFSALTRGLEQLNDQYNNTQAAINDAQLTLNLEDDPTSARFTVLEEPRMSATPASPNRFAVMILTLAIAVALGAVVVAAAERSDQAVRNAQDVIDYLEIPPLVGIPYVENRVDLKRKARRRLLAASMVSLWIGAIFLMVVTPL